MIDLADFHENHNHSMALRGNKYRISPKSVKKSGK